MSNLHASAARLMKRPFFPMLAVLGSRKHSNEALQVLHSDAETACVDDGYCRYVGGTGRFVTGIPASDVREWGDLGIEPNTSMSAPAQMRPTRHVSAIEAHSERPSIPSLGRRGVRVMTSGWIQHQCERRQTIGDEIDPEQLKRNQRLRSSGQ